MKKIVALLILAVSISTATFAQEREHKMEKLTDEQLTEISLKKMTLKLDLTPAQQRQIKPLLAERVAHKKQLKAKRKSLKEKGDKLSADERYEAKSKMLDKQIAFKTKMKKILNEKQYERFEKSQARKVHKAKKRVKKHKKHSDREERR